MHQTSIEGGVLAEAFVYDHDKRTDCVTYHKVLQEEEKSGRG